MKGWSAERVAQAAGARLHAAPEPGTGGPERATIDSRAAGAGALFVGLRGRSADGGTFAAPALGAGAWGALIAPAHAEDAVSAGRGAVLVAEDPLAALQRLAREWRRELGAKVIGVTGSTGKTSTKDLLLGVLAPHRQTVASRANFNTEIGLPLEILAAPAGTDVLVLEMAMRGAGQIAELTAIAEPDVGVIVTIGPVHLELLGTIEAIAAAKAELLAGLAPGSVAVVPVGEPLLEPHLRPDLRTVTFGDGGDVRFAGGDVRFAGGDGGFAGGDGGFAGGDGRFAGGDEDRVEIEAGEERISLEVSFTQAHLRRNLLAAVAAARAVGVRPSGRVVLALSPGRGQRTTLPDGVTLIDDCYNANPVSMRAALDELAAAARRLGGRPVAVLGDMLELGPDERDFHVAIGAYARERGVDALVAVGRLAPALADGFGAPTRLTRDAAEAAALVPEVVAPGDVVLVKASRGVGLELVCRALAVRADAASGSGPLRAVT
jgi:UDP-N-acetylmuramoyl-tripeptide--D-alanyl-D-alanine ligase